MDRYQPEGPKYWEIVSDMKKFNEFVAKAQLIRESTGTSNIEKTLKKAVKVFEIFDIPHFVCGGFAVQIYGYPRYTMDVDVIVPDVAYAREKLSLNGFKENPGSSMTLTDRETKVEIDLLPGGKSLDPGPLTLPIPTKVTSVPNFLTFEKLINTKLSSYMGRRLHRAKDRSDVIEMMKTMKPKRELKVDPKVRGEYLEIWDGLFK